MRERGHDATTRHDLHAAMGPDEIVLHVATTLRLLGLTALAEDLYWCVDTDGLRAVRARCRRMSLGLQADLLTLALRR
jgi:hypothetical protein